MKPKSLIKIALSILLVLLIARSVDFTKLKTTFQSIPPLTAVLVALGYLTGQFLSSIKWWRIVRAGGITVSYPIALKAYFIGMFVNLFGLGMTGGDVARGILVANGLPLKTEGITSVVADRIHGLAVLSFIALATSLILGNDHVPAYLILLLVGLLVGFLMFWVVGPWLLTNTPVISKLPIASKLKQVARLFPRDLKTLATISALSFVFHVLQISLHMVMAVGVGASIPWTTLFVVIPFVNIASSLPISWNGLGVRENSYTFFLTPLLLSNEQAIAFGAMWFFAVTVSSAIGGVVALCSGDMKLLKVQVPSIPTANHEAAVATE